MTGSVDHLILGAASYQTDYQVMIRVYRGYGVNSNNAVYIPSSECRHDFSDIRFADTAGRLLPYWIETTGTNYIDVWIKLYQIPTTGAVVRVLFGGGAITAGSSGTNTFQLFDDFVGSAIDTTLWDTSGTVTVSGGIESGTIISKSTFGSGYAARCRSAGTNTNAYLLAWADQLNMANWDAYRRSTDLGKFAYEMYPPVGNTVGTITADSNFHIFDIGKISTNSYFTMDGTYNGTIAACPNPATASKLMNYYTPGTSWDWVLVRAYIYPEPTHGWWGLLEDL